MKMPGYGRRGTACVIKSSLPGGFEKKELRISGRSFTLPLIVLICLFAAPAEVSAVGGISNSKVIVPSTDPVPRNHVEAEPFFILEFEDDRDDTVRFGGGVRLTLGALENLEVGANINYLSIEDSQLIRADSNFGDIEAGLKYRFLDEGNGYPLSLAYQGGATFPIGDGALWVFEPGGLILTKNFTDAFSMDTDFVFGVIEGGSWSFVTEAGFGYFFNDWFQAVLEGAYAYEDTDGEGGISIINITAGFTAQATDWLTVIMGVTPDLYARNTDKVVLITAAFTFFF